MPCLVNGILLIASAIPYPNKASSDANNAKCSVFILQHARLLLLVYYALQIKVRIFKLNGRSTFVSKPCWYN